MHALARNRSAIAVVAVVLAVIVVAWLVTSSGGDPERTAGPSAATDTASSAPKDDGADRKSTGKDTGTPSKDAGGTAGSGDSGGGTSGRSGSSDPGSARSGDDQASEEGPEPGNGTTGGGGGGGGGEGGGDDATTGAESEAPEPGTATGATVPVEPVQTLPPVPLESVGDFKTGLTVQLASLRAVEAEAKAPGEISGPALRVTVDAANDAKDALSLDGVVVFLSYGDDRTPASQFGSSSDPLMGDLAPGGSRTGTYVFTVPPDQRDDVRVEISYTGSAPTVAFTGSVDG